MEIQLEERLDILKLIVQNILHTKFGLNNNKSSYKISSTRLNFACPYCGDSSTNSLKKRGNLFLDSLAYHCYNCFIHKSLKQFCIDFNINYINNTQLLDLITDSANFVINKHNNESSIDYIVSPETQNMFINKNLLIDKFHLIEVTGSYAEAYLNDRCQYNFNNFLYSRAMEQLYILNIDNKTNKVIGWQIRNLNKRREKQFKYMTFKYSKACELLGLEIPKDSDKLDKLSITFNIFNISFRNDINVFEGPLDCFLLKNSIALSTIGTSVPFESNKFRYIFDYDNDGKKKTIDYLNLRKNVFMWKKFMNDHNILLNKNKIDWNDIIKYCYLNSINIQNFDTYFTNDPLNIILL